MNNNKLASNENIDSSKSHELLNHVLNWLRPSLRNFVEEILESDIGQKFKRLPASMNHHHNHETGLLRHSVECALMTGHLAITCLNRKEAELTVVAALLHDIGKCSTFQSETARADLGHFMEHEACTLELLAPYLAKLESEWRLGANMLRHMLSHEYRRGKYPAFPGTLLIKMTDQFSTALDRRRTIFSELPKHHHYAYDSSCGQKYTSTWVSIQSVVYDYVAAYELWNGIDPTFIHPTTHEELGIDDSTSVIQEGIFIKTKSGEWTGPFYLSDLKRFTQNIKRWIVNSKSHNTIN